MRDDFTSNIFTLYSTHHTFHMKNIFFKRIPATLIFAVAVCLLSNAQNNLSHSLQTKEAAKGTLFIIGGGNCPDTLLQRMFKEAGWKKGDEVVIMTLSSSYDSSYIWENDELARFTGYPAVKFDSASVHNEKKLDSLGKAKIIYICGGDQSRFMNLIRNSDVKKIIHQAYFKGALIAGTSAGAAVMSEKMITGNQLLDTAYESTFGRIRSENLELQEGLGLLDSVIVDMHFITRSRFNRLFTAVLECPKYQCIGIDESTAMIVHGNKATVSGASQVIVFIKPGGIIRGSNHLIGGNFSVSVYLPGESFRIKN